jgi:hypothetical protein
VKEKNSMSASLAAKDHANLTGRGRIVQFAITAMKQRAGPVM